MQVEPITLALSVCSRRIARSSATRRALPALDRLFALTTRRLAADASLFRHGPVLECV